MERFITIPSNIKNISRIEPFLKEFFYKNNLPERCFIPTLISINECVNNAIVHGNGNNVDKKVRVRITKEKSQLLIQIEDEGNGFDIQSIKDPTLPENIKKERGRGIFMVRKLADEVDFLKGGSIVQIKFHIQSEHSVL